MIGGDEHSREMMCDGLTSTEGPSPRRATHIVGLPSIRGPHSETGNIGNIGEELTLFAKVLTTPRVGTRITAETQMLANRSPHWRAGAHSALSRSALSTPRRSYEYDPSAA